MSNSARINGISNNTERMLLEGENVRCDFKRTCEGINAEDFVAFANSELGGAILVGVAEDKGEAGEQIGSIIGCEVGDSAILQIVNKALSCLPPVAVNVSIENISYLPILRIEISSSVTKPHCSPKGIYCIRDRSRNRPLYPTELLTMFIETESRAFAERFESAAARITNDINQLEVTLDLSIRSMAAQLGWADSKLGDTESLLSSVLQYAHRIESETQDISARLGMIFRQDQRQDPIYNRERKDLTEQIVKKLKKDEKLKTAVQNGKKLSVELKGKAAREIAKHDLIEILGDALKILETQPAPQGSREK